MKTLTILTVPHPLLYVMAKEIGPEELLNGRVDDICLKDLVGDMLATMYLTRGAGLAAPQVGVSLRLFVADISPGGRSPFHVINPVISEPEGLEVDLEGCLSVPGVKANVARFRSVLVTGSYLDGNLAKFRANGMMARVCQHEVDHLNGILLANGAIGVSG